MHVRHFISAALGAAFVLVSTASGFADSDDWHRHEWREHASHEHEWREHEWHEHHGYYAPPPYARYYAPPPVYYAPPPYWYGYGVR
jgi:hypothetical protein